MERSASWPIPLAVIGSVLATAVTLFQYIQAHRAGQAGGYLPIVIGALVVGLLVAGCGYFAKQEAARSALASGLLGALASAAFIAILFVTLIGAFGS